MSTWALLPTRPIPRRPGPLFWTGQDYTADVSKALTFKSEDDARRWLNVHRHLRLLQVVEVIQPTGRQ